MGRRNRAALLPTHLPQLQNLIKRDPQSYESEFLQQYRHYQSTLSIFCLKPDEEAKELCELVTFISQVTQCYPKQTEEFPQQLVDLLQQHCIALHPEVRRTFVTALILLRNKKILDNTRLLPLFFTLFKCRDKPLRELLYSHIVTDIKNANAKAKNNKLNKSLQSYMFTILESVKTGNSDENAIAAKKSVDVCIELYNKQIWDDAKTVNVIAEACFSPVTKIAVTAIRFFLNTNEEKEESDDEEELPDIRKMQAAQIHSKKTRAKSRKLEMAKKKVHKKQKSKSKAESFNFSALHLLNDPQGFAEKLYSKLSSKEDRWEVRVLLMNLISRVVGIHQLSLLGFYPFLIKYLQPSQRDVTMVLVAAAQASHPLVPPDSLEPVLKAIANNFITDRVANEVMAVGLNGIREICVRQPLAMNETLLQDLAQYKSHRDKGISMGARSLIGLYREVNPEMLHRKDRGRAATMRLKDGSIKTMEFGAVDTSGADGLHGVELLEEASAEKGEDEEDGWEGWEVDEDSSDSDSEGWIDVSDDEDNQYLNIVLSDEEEDDEGGDKKMKEENKDEKDEKSEEQQSDPNQKKKRRIGKRQLKKILESEQITEEQKQKLREQAEAKRLEEEKKREAMLKVASTRILTPADFAKLNELREKEETALLAGVKKRPAEESVDGQVNESTILGPRKKAKMDYEERMASIQEGREGREKFGSKKGKKERASTTNKEKARNKNFMMIAHKHSVVSKGKRSLVEKQKALREHNKRQKNKKR